MTVSDPTKTLPMQDPVFIHSLFRAGSTYLFNVFRRSENDYWCYQEPLHEFLIHLNNDADELLNIGSDLAGELRHPGLNNPYYWEYYEIKDRLKGLFHKSFSYDDFFVETASGLPEEQVRYFGALIDNSKGRPVLQFCRSGGRAGALKQVFGGKHIHLWREPRNQWWSYKVDHHFDLTVQLIYNARLLPPVLEECKRRCGVVDLHSKDIGAEFRKARNHRLDANTNYFVFYALWLYAFLECEKYSDITISIDQLSDSYPYRVKTLQGLTKLGIDELDFSDCAVPRASFSGEEHKFFRKIESQVKELFLMHGYSKTVLGEVEAVHENVLELPGSDNRIQEARARKLILRYLNLYVEQQVKTQAIYASCSWRITAPLRWAYKLLRMIGSKLK